jgi:tetratricopeptide (TPR) repeat protein
MSFFKKLFGSSDPVAEEKPKDESKNFDILKYDGVRALRTGQAEYAAKCFEHALALNDDLECRDYLSQALLQLGDLPASYEQLKLMAASCPDNDGILLRMADIAYMMEDYPAMLDVCQKALLIDDANPTACFMHARASHGEGDDDTAVAMLNKALELDSERDAARLFRGQVYLAQQNYDAATADVQTLLERVGDNEDVLLLKAHIAEATNNLDEALATYDKVIDVAPFCVEAFRGRGLLRQQLGDAEGAAADLQMAGELDSNTPANSEGVEQKVKDAYKSIDPYGVFGN